MKKSLIQTGTTWLNDNLSQNAYILTLTDLPASISVLSVQGDERLDKPWRYEVTFTSPDKHIRVSSVLTQSASFSFKPHSVSDMLRHISSLDTPAMPRTLYGVVTEFSQLSVNKDEAHYRVVLAPRLALLANDCSSAIYQNQSVVSVVESVLRRHGFTGVDYRLELKETYPAREFITQWQESDLAFVQRLLADVGIWLRFESHAEHHCDVLVLSDYEQGLANAGHIVYKTPSGMGDNSRHSVWDLQLTGKTVTRQVMVNDYNYRDAEADRYGLVNTEPKDSTTVGTDYRYGEHYKAKGDGESVESGHWYATIRHQQHISEKVIIRGKCNDYRLAPGQRIVIDGSPLGGISEGILILSTQSHGDRSAAYEMEFTAIPYDVLKPYRPLPIDWPQIGGTLPARVTSPDNDTYGYIDTMGRYRVKFDFDLKTWRSGEESLWVRLAKPYAGDSYGFHFPLIDGTEVAIAFTDGNPDRPYIAHAMHDSTHPDHVTTANKHRNVIRTPANNKLRMDDQRGQEHIKLATEYGKTQLNMGHLVDEKKENRGHGFELRTDEYGAIRAGKGLYITTYARTKAEKKSIGAIEAKILLDSAGELTKNLSKQAKEHRANSLSAVGTLENFINYIHVGGSQSDSNNFSEPGMILASPKGIAQVTAESIHYYAQQNILLTNGNDLNIATGKSMNVSINDDLSLFARNDIKLFSGGGKVQVQAHNNDIEIVADQTLRIISNEDKVSISAKKEITIACGGAYIRFSGGNIQIHAPGQIEHNATLHPFLGPKSMSPTLYSFPEQKPLEPYIIQFVLLQEDSDKPIIGRKYQILNQNNQVVAEGVTDSKGMTEIVDSEYKPETFTIRYKNEGNK